MKRTKQHLPISYKRIVRNQSERTDRIKIIVVHDTESHDYQGISDLKSLGAWFDNPRAQVSAHICTDKEGHIAKYVGDAKKSWACAGYNSVSLNIEQVGYARYTRRIWLSRIRQLKATAKVLAYWSLRHDIPLHKGKVSNGRVIKKGVLRHSDLGIKGGGHSDPGRGYPLALVLRL